jgi:hypothetical protein
VNERRRGEVRGESRGERRFEWVWKSDPETLEMDGEANRYDPQPNGGVNRIYGMHVFRNLNISLLLPSQILSASRCSHNLYAPTSLRLLHLVHVRG